MNFCTLCSVPTSLKHDQKDNLASLQPVILRLSAAVHALLKLADLPHGTCASLKNAPPHFWTDVGDTRTVGDRFLVTVNKAFRQRPCNWE